MPGASSPAISRNDEPGALELGVEETRDFHFAVTWVTLFAHLDPTEAAGPWHPPVIQPRETPSTALALVPVAASPARQSVASNAAWEMVVPKMIRTGPGNFTPAEDPDPERP